jgi:predicted nucleotide-binding protein
MEKADKVFISYVHQDQEWVEQLTEELTRKGINVWLAEKEISAGESIADKLEEGLRSSGSMIFVLGPESIHSSNLFFELGAALGMGKRIIAVVNKNVGFEDLPGPIRLRKYLQMEDPKHTAEQLYPLLAAG